ncbi:rhomboid family intramembrane serine protease [Myxococcota bacterium]|nr:rhomboid family intramembrane serine protease [Myxococcota bacterium]
MFPIRDDNPHFLTPWTTWALVATNVLAWALVQGFGTDPALARSVCAHGLRAGELLQTVAAGARFPVGPDTECVVTNVAHPLTLLTHMFLHGGWMHIVGNLWFLWIFGNNVEDSMGHLRFGVFYLLCGLFAAFAQILADPSSGIPMIGASGAIGGVMGAYLMLYPRVRVHMLVWFGFYVTTIPVPAVWMLAYWFLVQVLGGVVALGHEGGGVAFWAHVGGFLAGVVLVVPFRRRALVDRHPYHGWRGLHELDLPRGS